MLTWIMFLNCEWRFSRFLFPLWVCGRVGGGRCLLDTEKDEKLWKLVYFLSGAAGQNLYRRGSPSPDSPESVCRRDESNVATGGDSSAVKMVFHQQIWRAMDDADDAAPRHHLTLQSSLTFGCWERATNSWSHHFSTTSFRRNHLGRVKPSSSGPAGQLPLGRTTYFVPPSLSVLLCSCLSFSRVYQK